VQAILDAAAALLETQGLEALSTSAIAERLGLHVRNVYRYFPNREAVLHALAHALNARIEALIRETYQEHAVLSPSVLRSVLSKLVEVVMQTPGGLQIRMASKTSLALQAIEIEMDQRIAQNIAEGMTNRSSRVADSKLQLRLFALVTAVRAVLDRSQLHLVHGAQIHAWSADELIEEASALIQGRFSALLEEVELSKPES
jgi:AcrR family transcriptional regulator